MDENTRLLGNSAADWLRDMNFYGFNNNQNKNKNKNKNNNDNVDNDDNDDEDELPLTRREIKKLRRLLAKLEEETDNDNNDDDDDNDDDGDKSNNILDVLSLASDYTEFAETTHAWAVFADHPNKRASYLDRLVGTSIICFQLFTYSIYAREAIEDYAAGQVVVTTSHAECLLAGEEPTNNFHCDANFTNNFDAFVAYFMLGIFMTPDFLQAARAIRGAPQWNARFFACLAGIEVVAAYISASIAVAYNLYIGEITDAVEVGVGLLFIRELSSQTYHGIRQKGNKTYGQFFIMLSSLVLFGFWMDPICEKLFASK